MKAKRWKRSVWDFPVQLIQTNETLKRTESLNLRNVSNFVSFVINFCCTQQHNNVPNTTTLPTQHNNTTGLPTLPQIYHLPSPFDLFKPFIQITGFDSQDHVHKHMRWWKVLSYNNKSTFSTIVRVSTQFLNSWELCLKAKMILWIQRW